MKIKRIGIKCGCVVDFSIFGCDLFKRTSEAMLEAKVVKTVVAADYRIMKLAENGDLIITARLWSCFARFSKRVYGSSP